MITFMLLASHGMSVLDYFELYRVQTPGCTGVWDNKLKFVLEKDKADFFVAFDHIPNPEIFDPERTVIFGREPKPVNWLYCDLSNTKVRYPLHYDLGNCYYHSRWWVQRTYDYLMHCSHAMCAKSGRIGAVLSFHLDRFPGHAHRVAIARELLRRLDFDLYGKLCSILPKVEKSKGRLMGIVDDKFDALSPYGYAFCADNSSFPGFFGDTLVDGFLSWCRPIYWGCPNLEDYFPRDSFINITGLSLEGAVRRIVRAVRKPPTEHQIKAIGRARQLILNKYNFWPTLLEVLETGSVSWGPRIKLKVPDRSEACQNFEFNSQWYT